MGSPIPEGVRDILLDFGIAGSSATLLAMLLHRLWGMVTAEKTSMTRDKAEDALYQILKNDLLRLGAELAEVQKRLEALERRHRVSQSVAVEAYAALSALCVGFDCPDFSGVKQMLLKIIND